LAQHNYRIFKDGNPESIVMGLAKTMDLIKRSPTEEVLTEQTLKEYIESNTKLRHYIGFEISGFVHLGTGLLCMQKVADFQQAGVETNVFLADYHSWINKKLGGDLPTIQKIASGYFKDALKWSLKCVGGRPDKTNFILGSKLYEKLGRDYLENIIKVSMKTTLSRAMRGVTIMGRKKGESMSFGQLLYVPMQVADIYSLKVNLPQGGMDQRKAHVIAIEVWKQFGYKLVAVHNHLLMGMNVTKEQRNNILKAKRTGNRELLEEGFIDIKMSKSKPNSAIFIHDTEAQVRNKVMRAYCPPNEVELNPIIDLMRFIVLPSLQRASTKFELVNMKTSRRKTYETSSEIEKDYKKGEIHPSDLKQAVTGYLVKMLAPARKHFLEGSGRKYLEEMKVTR
jgi:tyrosyl-tRNA synthetase